MDCHSQGLPGWPVSLATAQHTNSQRTNLLLSCIACSLRFLAQQLNTVLGAFWCTVTLQNEMVYRAQIDCTGRRFRRNIRSEQMKVTQRPTAWDYSAQSRRMSWNGKGNEGSDFGCFGDSVQRLNRRSSTLYYSTALKAFGNLDSRGTYK